MTPSWHWQKVVSPTKGTASKTGDSHFMGAQAFAPSQTCTGICIRVRHQRQPRAGSTALPSLQDKPCPGQCVWWPVSMDREHLEKFQHKCLLQRFTKEVTRKKTLHQAGAATNGGQQAELCQHPSPALFSTSQHSPTSPRRNPLPPWHHSPPASATQPDLLTGTQQEQLSTSPAIPAQPHTSLRQCFLKPEAQQDSCLVISKGGSPGRQSVLNRLGRKQVRVCRGQAGACWDAQLHRQDVKPHDRMSGPMAGLMPLQWGALCPSDGNSPERAAAETGCWAGDRKSLSSWKSVCTKKPQPFQRS